VGKIKRGGGGPADPSGEPGGTGEKWWRKVKRRGKGKSKSGGVSKAQQGRPGKGKKEKGAGNIILRWNELGALVQE